MSELFVFPSLSAPKFPSLSLPSRLHGLLALWTLPLFCAAPSSAAVPLALVLAVSLPGMIGLARGAWQCWYLVFAQLLAFPFAVMAIAPNDLDRFALAGAGAHLAEVCVLCRDSTVRRLVGFGDRS